MSVGGAAQVATGFAPLAIVGGAFAVITESNVAAILGLVTGIAAVVGQLIDKVYGARDKSAAVKLEEVVSELQQVRAERDDLRKAVHSLTEQVSELSRRIADLITPGLPKPEAQPEPVQP